jgi:hypothetical protein
VFGGALAFLHSAQVSNFRIGLLLPSDTPILTGFNVTVLISKSFFIQSSVFSKALSGRLGDANGAGGAVYASSVALTDFRVTDSMFSSSRATVIGGTSGLPSSNSGGALAIDAGSPNASSVTISSSSFFNCTVQGDNVSSMAARGGAVYVTNAAHITVTHTRFTNCSVVDAAGGSVVSGGASLVAFVQGGMVVDACEFDASGGLDMSETSTGLLVLTHDSSFADLNVSGCTFISSAVVLSVKCVDKNGAENIGGCFGPSLMLKNATVIQIPPPQMSSTFTATGSTLMYLQSTYHLSITDGRLRCALPQFAAFQEQNLSSTANTWAYSCKPCAPLQISLSSSEVSLEKISNAKNVDRCFLVSGAKTSGCPFAVVDCTTFVNVSIGF